MGYTFKTLAKSTRSGFYHKVWLYNELGEEITNKRVSYLNRTWERFPFETAKRLCIEKAIKLYPKLKDELNKVEI